MKARSDNDPMWNGATGLSGDLHLVEPQDWFEAECSRRVAEAIRDTKDALEAAQGERDAANDRATQAEATADRLETEVGSLTKQLAQEKSEHQTTRKQATELQDRAFKAESQLKSIHLKYEAANHEMVSLADRVATLEEENALLKGKANSLRASSTEQNEARDKAAAEAKAQGEANAAEIAQLKAHHEDEMKSVVAKAGYDLDTVRKGYETEIKELQAQVSEATTRLEKEMNAQKTELEAKIKGWEAAYIEMETELKAASDLAADQLMVWRIDCEQSQAEHAKLKEWHEREMSRTIKDSRAFKAQIASLNDTIDTLKQNAHEDGLIISNLREMNATQSKAVDSVSIDVEKLVPLLNDCLEEGGGPPTAASSYILGVQQVDRVFEMDRFARKVITKLYKMAELVQVSVDSLKKAKESIA